MGVCLELFPDSFKKHPQLLEEKRKQIAAKANRLRAFDQSQPDYHVETKSEPADSTDNNSFSFLPDVKSSDQVDVKLVKPYRNLYTSTINRRRQSIDDRLSVDSRQSVNSHQPSRRQRVIFDTGADCHMINDPSLFESIHQSDILSVSGVSGEAKVVG